MPTPRRIGTKLLAIILPCLLVGTIASYLLYERLSARERLSALELRLDTFVVTLSAALVKPLWEFDDLTVQRLMQAATEVP